jgi:SAM-dependent methyltransferase
MRENVRAFVAIAASALELRGPVYEFGSLQVQGQEALADLRPLFPSHDYVGCDMRQGPGVDRVEDLAELSLPDACAQTVICVDTLEHVFEARRAVAEMIRVLKPGGTLLLAAPFDFRIHDHPSDYWRLTPSCVARLLAPLAASIVGSQGLEAHPHTVLGVGCKGPLPADFPRQAQRFVDEFAAWAKNSRAAAPVKRRVKQFLRGLLVGKGQRRRQREFYSARFAIELPKGADWRPMILQRVAPGTAGAPLDRLGFGHCQGERSEP